MHQLLTVVLVCLMLDVIIKPVTFSQTSAQGEIIGTCINFGLVVLLSMPIILLVKRHNISVLLSKGVVSKIILVVLILLFAFSSAQVILSAEHFYRFVSDNLLPVWVIVGIFILVAVYAMSMGVEAVSRSAIIVGVMLAFSVVFIIVANLDNFSFSNLQFSQDPVQEGLDKVKAVFWFPIELLVYAVLIPHVPAKKRKSFTRVLPLYLTVSLVLIFSQEMVLGKFAAMQAQPVHTLARIGSISVFTRLDSIHVSVWMILAMFKISVCFLVMVKLIRLLLPKATGKKNEVVGVVVLLMVVWFCFAVPNFNLDLGVSLTTLVMSLLIPMLLGKVRVKNDKKTC